MALLKLMWVCVLGTSLNSNGAIIHPIRHINYGVSVKFQAKCKSNWCDYSLCFPFKFYKLLLLAITSHSITFDIVMDILRL